MKLILGLGNPEKHYDGTRHNIGFYMLDAFIGVHGGKFTKKTKLSAEITELNLHGQKLLLAKPTTYYNDSGVGYRSVLDFYKLAAEDTLIIHDELALPFGTIRLRHGGSDAGNNGIKSINANGGQMSSRIRIGVTNPLRQTIGDTDFVLSRFSKEESDHLSRISQEVIHDIEKFVSGDFVDTSYSLNQ